MSRLKQGIRQLVDDAQRIGFAVSMAVAIFAAGGAGLWLWWASLWHLPPPVRALGVMVAFLGLGVCLYAIVVVGHKYLGVPSAHPRELSSPRRPIGPPTSRSSGNNGPGQGRWLSREEREAEAVPPDRSESPASIPDGQFVVDTKESKRGRGGLYLLLRNVHETRKTGYSMRVIAAQLWSDALGNGSGGFGLYGPFQDRGRSIELIETGARPGKLDFHDPTSFELLKPSMGAWQMRDRGGGQPLALRDGIWRFGVELTWNGGTMPLSYDVRLTTRNNIKTAVFVTYEPQQQGPDA